MLFRINENIDSKTLKSKLDKKISDRGLDNYSFGPENYNSTFDGRRFVDENVPIVGGRWHIVFIKKIVRKCTRFVVRHITKQQNTINYEIFKKIAELESIIKSQRLEIDRLKEKIKKAKR